MSVHDLPAVNASLNGLSAVFLTAGFIFIRRKNKIAHRNCMVAAFGTSVLFLTCYLTYHAIAIGHGTLARRDFWNRDGFARFTWRFCSRTRCWPSSSCR